MKLTGSRADKYCAAPPAASLGALLFGPDRGLVTQRSKHICAKFVSDPNDAFNVTILTADDLANDPARLSDEMAAMSLLGEARLIRLRLGHERQGAAIGKMIARFDADPSRCAAKLVIEAGDMTPRSAIRKAFEAAANFAALPCYQASGRALENLIKDQLTAIGDHGIGIDKEALTHWAPLLEGDRALAVSEIEKLALYKGYGEHAGTRIKIEDINILAAGGQAGSIDEIIQSAFTGNQQLCDDAFRRAMSGKLHPAVILRSVQRHLTRLHEALSAMDHGKSSSEAMRGLRPPVFSMQQSSFERQLRLWSLPALARILDETLTAERRLKTAGSPDIALTGRLLGAIATIASKR